MLDKEPLQITARDRFLTHPLAQPKLGIAAHIEKTCPGIKVPRRFSSYAEGLNECGTIFLRSEHPQEYAGVSGLFESFAFSQEDITRWRAEHSIDPSSKDVDFSVYENNQNNMLQALPTLEKILAHIGLVPDEDIVLWLRRFFRHKAEAYGEELGTKETPDEILEQLSFSAWEYIEGLNGSIVADTGVPGRYHIFLHGERNGNRFVTHTIVERGTVIKSEPHDIANVTTDAISTQSFIDLYEQVRHAPGFDQTHSPIVEFQYTDNGDIYFLQYHRAQDKIVFREPFTLGRAPEEGEIEASFVRGATDPEGVEIHVEVRDRWLYRGHNQQTTRDGAYGAGLDIAFSDSMSRLRTANLREMRTPKNFSVNLADGHNRKSLVFKPEVFIGLPEGALKDAGFDKFHRRYDQLLRDRGLSDEEAYEYMTETPIQVPMRVISDGNRAFVKVLKTPEEVLKDIDLGLANKRTEP